MPKITLLTVGKLRDKNILSLENSFLKRIKQINLSIIELKSYSGDDEREGQDILKKIADLKEKTAYTKVILLTEQGKKMSSEEMVKNLDELFENGHTKQLIFVIGGALGFSEKIKCQFKTHWSLSTLTFPHQFARLLFVEQIYRVETIKYHHPYHH